jgi:hypothetical protein
MHIAFGLHFGEVMFAPIPADDVHGREALESLGARRAQTYQLFEKKLS